MSLLDLDDSSQNPSGDTSITDTGASLLPVSIPGLKVVSPAPISTSPRFHGSHIHPSEQSRSPVAVAYDT